MSRIPKIIHYCWFGGNPLPELIQRCIASWKKYCPDYEIIQWDETTFDVNSNRFVAEAYAAKKWAFVSDYVRLHALFHYGGIYLDTDMELLRPVDHFLGEQAFFGFEANDVLGTAIMGFEKKNKLISELLCYYEDRPFFVNGEMDITPNTFVLTDQMVSRGLRLNGKQQTIDGCVIYPAVVFSPNNLLRLFDRYSSKTFGVHHFMESWGASPSDGKRGFRQRLRRYLVKTGCNLIGTSNMYKLGQLLKK